MTSPWIPRFAVPLAYLLLVGALVFLQAQDAEKDLVYCLPAYGVIAVAALIAVAASRHRATTGMLCLCSTAVFCGYLILRALLSPANYAARFDLYSILAALTVYGITISAVITPKRRIALILSLLAFAVVHVLVSVVQAGFGENLMIVRSLEDVLPSARGSGLYVDPDHLAGLLELLGALGLGMACWSRWPRWSRVVVGYVTLVCYFGVVLTGSRAGYFSSLASLALFALLSLIVLWSGGAKLLLRFGGGGIVMLAIAITAAVVLIYQIPALKDRVQNMVYDEGRLGLWNAAIEQWKLQPVIGTGSGTYLFYGRKFRAEAMQADPIDVHNDYLHLLCEYGLIGLGGFLFFFFAHLCEAWRAFMRMGPGRVGAGALPLSDRLALIIGSLCAIGAYVVHSALDFNLHIPANALLLAFAFGIIAAPGVTDESALKGTTYWLPRYGVIALAVVLLFQCVRLLPGEHFGELARRALRDEDPSAAISFADKALGFEQQNPNIFFYRGRALAALGREQTSAQERLTLYSDALKAFESARALVPLDGTYPLEIGRILDTTGRFSEAEEMYQFALARDPRSTGVTQMYQAHLKAWEKQVEKNSPPEK